MTIVAWCILALGWCFLAAAYELGDERNVLCWVRHANSSSSAECAYSEGHQLVDCNGSSIHLSADSDALLGSARLVASKPKRITYVAHLASSHRPPSGFIDHINVHSCDDGVFCTPFVSNTPGLATHTEAQTGIIDDSGAVAVESVLLLPAGTYTVIAHARWFSADGSQRDMAIARLSVRVHDDLLPYWQWGASVVLPALLLCGIVTLLDRRRRERRRRERALFRLRRTRQPPHLEPLGAPTGGDSPRWHLFLSHTWSTGQNQVALIKTQLQRFLPKELRIFRDIDDLLSVDDLESCVRQSIVVLLFVSEGYFTSPNCMRELRAAVEADKPCVVVYEAERSKGGAPWAELLAECPADLRSALSGGVVTEWLMLKQFHEACLMDIAEQMLAGLASTREGSVAR